MTTLKAPQGRPVVMRTKNGHGPRIYRQKRPSGFDDEWRLRHMIGGRYFYFKLGTDAKKAEGKALDIEARLGTGETPESVLASMSRFGGDTAIAAKYATLGEIADALTTAGKSLELRDSTVDDYVFSLLMVARVVAAKRRGKNIERRSGARKVLEMEAARLMPSTVLLGSAARDFKAAMIDGLNDGDHERRAKRTANSYLRGAKAVFSKEAMRRYGHLKLPDLSGFMTEPPFRKVSKKYRIPEDAVLERVLADGPKELVKDSNVYVAYLLALHAGLRKTEIAHAQRGWLTDTRPFRIWVRAEGDFNPKGGEDGFAEISSWAHAQIVKHAKGVSYLLEGHDTEREEVVFRRLNAWLRTKGLDRPKPLHELRKLFGSYIASTQGLFVAQKFLRHQDAQVTSDSYADVVLSPRILAFWKGAA